MPSNGKDDFNNRETLWIESQQKQHKNENINYPYANFSGHTLLDKVYVITYLATSFPLKQILNHLLPHCSSAVK